MRLLWVLIWASSFFALSLQKPRSWKQDARDPKQGQGWRGDSRRGVGQGDPIRG